MSKKYYDEEFRIQAVKLSHMSPKPVAETARELGIHESLLYKWRQRIAPDGNPTKQAIEDEQMKHLLAENARLKRENDMLKKATAYFANLSK